jgi:hypothetical protein
MNIEKYYLVQVIYEVEESDRQGNPKIRRVREKYLVSGNTISDAEQRASKALKNILNDFEITQIREFQIMGII